VTKTLFSTAALEEVTEIKQKRAYDKLNQLHLPIIALGHARKEAEPDRGETNQLESESYIKKHNSSRSILSDKGLRKTLRFDYHETAKHQENPMSKLLKAAPFVEEKLEHLKLMCAELKDKGLTPRMEVILVGVHRASKLYTTKKKKFCESFGAECEIHRLDEKIDEASFLRKLKEMAENPKVHGCFVQLPLPDHLSGLDVAHLIPPEKDVDGFHPENLYNVMLGSGKALWPCTPLGIMQLLEYYQIPVLSKHVVIIGRSMIVGKPLAQMMTNANATVTLCHSRTKNLHEYTKQADIIVSAVGRSRYLNESYLNEGGQQVLIDVGINHDEEGKLCGDIDAEKIKDKVHAYTPVPGGVGPLTILSLSQNLLQAAKNHL
jgi:methylenetetrahydrofolate dehydrogenase (NADP+)/methenyltetrahydrofolate cyclohydrolase